MTTARKALEEAPIAGVGLWAWFLQRVTAALAVIFLGAHLWALHIFLVGEEITFERVLERLQSPLYIALDILLLATLIYHALNGVRMIILDFTTSLRAERLLNTILILTGVIGFALGVYGLWPFISG